VVLHEIDFVFKKFADGFKPVTFAESSSLNTDMCMFESSQSEESRAQSANSSKACSKPRACKGSHPTLVMIKNPNPFPEKRLGTFL